MSASIAFRTEAKTFVVYVMALALAGCETLSAQRERQICEMSPNICVDGQLRAQRLSPVIILPGTLPLPDLTVNTVGCDPVFGEVWLGAHIANQGAGPLPALVSSSTSPQQVDAQVTLYPGTSAAIVLPLNSLVPPDPMAGQSYYKIARIPDADPANMPLTLFQVYVNPPELGAPAGQFDESNLQNNANCGVCSCRGGQCSVIQTPACTAGP